MLGKPEVDPLSYEVQGIIYMADSVMLQWLQIIYSKFWMCPPHTSCLKFPLQVGQKNISYKTNLAK